MKGRLTPDLGIGLDPARLAAIVTRRNSPGMKSPKPVAARQVIVHRNPLPEVNRMLADAYHTLAAQLREFKSHGDRARFDVKEATAFNKLITSLTTLQETERKNAALLELSKLSPAELEALSGQAAAMLSTTSTDSTPD
jgi:hypothetical protein